MNENAFPTIFDLRYTHTHLLGEQRKGIPFDQLRPEVSSFVMKARQTGAVLDVEDQRVAAQGLIDYWLTKLDRADVPFDDATLVDFDENLAPELEDDQCPYVGLEAFREKDARNFFGRRETLEKALDVIRKERFLSVIGPSGSGKSSIVLAGVLPMLEKDGAISGSKEWRYATPFAPGSEPVENYVRAVKNVPPGTTPLVVTIDQFEELFTLTENASVRVAFANTVADVVKNGGIVIATIREDYVPRLGAHPELAELFRRGDLRATPLSAAELREAIEAPAQRINLKFDAGLVEALVADVVGEPAALPLLQFTLWRLWTKRKRNRLTREAYREVGGGRSALARAADELYDDLKMVQNQDTMRRILMRMVRAGTHAETTSGRVLVSTLMTIGDDPARVQAVLDKLIAAKLVRRTGGETAGDDQVEVAHEALIRNWPKLVEWVEQKKASLTEYRRFEALADEWERFGREYGYLDAEQLKDAEKWLKSDEAKELGMKESLPALVDASRKLLEKNKRAQRRAKAILVLVLTTIIGALIWAVLRERRALDAQNKALADARTANDTLRKTIDELKAARTAGKTKDKEIDLLSQAVQVVQDVDSSRRPEAIPFVPLTRSSTLNTRFGSISACCMVGAPDGTSYLLTSGASFAEGDKVTLSSGLPVGVVARLIGFGATSVALVKLDGVADVPTLPIKEVAGKVRPSDRVLVGLGTGRVVVAHDDEIVITLSADDVDVGAPVLTTRRELVGIVYASDKSLSRVLPLAPLFQREMLQLR